MKLRFLIPALVLAAFVADVGLRFVPPQQVAFRAWEPASLYATAEGWFAPNFHYENDHSYGDLANLGNLPSFRQYRHEVFTTDEFGYRNSPRAGGYDMPAAILVGDSLPAGDGNSDDETLSAQLMSHLPGKAVYNAAGGGGNWIMTNQLIQRLHMRGGLVIWEVFERTPLPQSLRQETATTSGVIGRLAPPGSDRYRTLQKAKNWTQSYLAYSPLSIYLTRGFQKIENGIWLPNPTGSAVYIGQLRNGDRMLFLDLDVQRFYHPLQDSGDYLSEISDRVHATGNELLVLLVPEKYNVYYPVLSEKDQAPAEARLDLLEKNLHRLGIPVINVTPSLRTQAEGELDSRDYNYWIDDTHWNRSGIQTVATDILRAWSDPSGSASPLGSVSIDAIRRNTSAPAQ